MIQDILKANPGMEATMRAHAREMYVELRIKDLEQKRRTLEKRSEDATVLKEIDESLAKYRTRLALTKQEIILCKEAEIALRKVAKIENEPVLSAK